MCDFNELNFQRLINLANGKTFYATAPANLLGKSRVNQQHARDTFMDHGRACFSLLKHEAVQETVVSCRAQRPSHLWHILALIIPIIVLY
jgi:hypothetical protein